VFEIASPDSKPDTLVTNGKSRVVVQAVYVLPVTVAVLAPLMKFGTLVLAPMGAKLTVVVMAVVGAVTAPALDTKYTGTENVEGEVENAVSS
jgi:hypothetical protein